MARINVEQKALTDPRFYMLGDLAGAPPDFAHEVGLARSIRLWNEAVERETDVLRGEIAQAIMRHTNGAQWFVDADLAEWADEAETMIRIKGSEGRTDYKKRLKLGQVAGGKKRAAGAVRDPKTGTFTSSTSSIQLRPGDAPPALSSAPAPAPALPEEESLPPTPFPSAPPSPDPEPPDPPKGGRDSHNKISEQPREGPRSAIAYQRAIKHATKQRRGEFTEAAKRFIDRKLALKRSGFTEDEATYAALAELYDHSGKPRNHPPETANRPP